MYETTIALRAFRKIWSFVPKKLITSPKLWQLLRHYPVIKPTDELFKEWNYSHWEEYQRWLEMHSLQSSKDWASLHQAAKCRNNPARISIVTPVFNTASEVLYECLLSVRMQTYPYWQWVLVDDGSTRSETLELLRSGVCKDPRIQVIFCEKSSGISAATNLAIANAKGDFVVFLDHDDRLSLDALSLLAQEIESDPSADIIYSDRDMISENGDRYLHLLKPNWSPETLLSGNYVFHLMCYKRELLNKLQGLRSDFDGSQDYDLILRAAETKPKVRHIAKILYHWRQHSASVALNVNAKDYAFQAGIRALNDTLSRRNINAIATEIPNFWRGTYQLTFTTLPKQSALQLISLNRLQSGTEYATYVTKQINNSTEPYIAIIGETISPATDDTLLNLAAWLTLNDVGLVTGKIITVDDKIDYVGIAYNKNGSLMYPYRNFAKTEPGYMGVTQIVRNISAPYPTCVIIRREVWKALNGFNNVFKGPHALLDFALRALNMNWRTVIVPQSIFFQAGNPFVAEDFNQDAEVFKNAWQKQLQHGDSYYNNNLAQNSLDMGLDV